MCKGVLSGTLLFSDGDGGCAPCVLVTCKEAVEATCAEEIAVSVVLTATVSSLAVTVFWLIFAMK